MLGSSLLLGALSGYMSRSDPGVAHAATTQPQRSRPSATGTTTLGSTDPSGSEDLLRCAAAWAHDYGKHSHSTQPWPSSWRENGVHAAEAVWSALRPGCRSCTVSHSANQSKPEPVSATLRPGRQEPRGLRAAASAHEVWEPPQSGSVAALTRVK